jgi:hypothetical protein
VQVARGDGEAGEDEVRRGHVDGEGEQAPERVDQQAADHDDPADHRGEDEFRHGQGVRHERAERGQPCPPVGHGAAGWEVSDDQVGCGTLLCTACTALGCAVAAVGGGVLLGVCRDLGELAGAKIRTVYDLGAVEEGCVAEECVARAAAQADAVGAVGLGVDEAGQVHGALGGQVGGDQVEHGQVVFTGVLGGGALGRLLDVDALGTDQCVRRGFGVWVWLWFWFWFWGGEPVEVGEAQTQAYGVDDETGRHQPEPYGHRAAFPSVDEPGPAGLPDRTPWGTRSGAIWGDLREGTVIMLKSDPLKK